MTAPDPSAGGLTGQSVEWWQSTCEYWREQTDEARRSRDLVALQAEQAAAENARLTETLGRVRAVADEWWDDPPDTPIPAALAATRLRIALGDRS